MKNRVKGLLALCLAMCMVLAMTTVAFGADPCTIYYGEISESGETMQAGDKIIACPGQNVSGNPFYIINSSENYIDPKVTVGIETAYDKTADESYTQSTKKYVKADATYTFPSTKDLFGDEYAVGYQYKVEKKEITSSDLYCPNQYEQGKYVTITNALKVTPVAKDGYEVNYDLAGGTGSISNKTNVKWTDKVLDGVTDPTKDGHKFVGWNYVDKEGTSNTTQVTETTTYASLAKSDSVMSITLTAVWEVIPDDETPTTPTPTHQHTRRQSATTTVETPTTTVASPKTFDAGIALYGVMAALSLTGTAAIIGKKRKF